MKRISLLMCIALIAVIPTAGAHKASIGSKVSISYLNGKFKGKVVSASEACERGRRIVVKRVEPEGDVTLGSDTTNDNGAWAHARAQSYGEFYVVVKPKEIDKEGHEHTCKAATSPLLRLVLVDPNTAEDEQVSFSLFECQGSNPNLGFGYEFGPETPQLGVGSGYLVLGANSSFAFVLLVARYDDQPLKSVKELRFSSYTEEQIGALSLALWIDPDGPEGPDGPVLYGFNETSGPALVWRNWRLTGDSTLVPATNPNDETTFAQLKAENPDATLDDTLMGSALVILGTCSAAWTSNMDAISVQMGNEIDLLDLEASTE